MTKQMRWIAVGTLVLLLGAAAYFALNQKAPSTEAPGASAAPAEPMAETPAAAPSPDAVEAASEEAVPAVAEPAALVETPSETRKAAREGRGRIWGKAMTPAEGGGLAVTVALHLVDTESAEISYEDNLVGKATAGPDGGYEFGGLPMGEYVLLASATGFTMNGAAHLEAKRAEDEVNLTLVPGGTVGGRVVNASGEPVAGAHVFVAGWNIQGQEADAPRSRALASQRVTDETGAFTIENLRKSLNNEPGYRLAAKAEGYATALSDYIQAGTQGITLVVKPGGVVSGRLVDAATGEALPDKTVILETSLSVDRYRGMTDAEGFFFLTDVPPGEHTAALGDPELVLAAETSKVLVTEGVPTEDVELRAGLGGKISGRFFDAQSGDGIAGVRVFSNVAVPNGSRSKEVKTDGSGTFVFAGMRPGSYRLEYSKPDGYPENYRDPNRQRTVSVALGEETGGIDFPMSRGLTISGRVVDEEGKAVPQAWVNGNSNRSGSSDNMQTRDDGSFALAGFVAGEEAYMSAGKDGMALMSIEPPADRIKVPAEGVSGVKVVLGVEASISGTVVTKSGTPKSGVEMWVRKVEKNNRSGGIIETSASDGSITFNRLAPGEYSFQFNNMPYDEDDARVQKVSVRKGEKLAGVRIVYPELGGLKISGRVVDTRGNGIPRANVQAQGPNWRRVDADAEGKFVVDGLAEGKVQVIAASSSHSAGTWVTVEAGAADVELVLKALATVEGRVVSAATARPVTNFRARAQGLKGQPFYSRYGFQSVSDPQGRFTLSNVEDGASSIEVRASGFADTTMALSGVVGGETKRDVLVQMSDGVKVAGRVVDSTGKGVGGAQIFVGGVPYEHQREEQQRAVSGSDGAFRLDSLSPGQVQLSASHSAYAPATATVNLSAGVENRVEIRMSAGGTIEGIVTVGGQPSTLAHVSWPGALQAAQCDAEGRYRLTGIPAGEVQLNVSVNTRGGAMNNWRNKNTRVEVRDGFVTEVNFNLSSGNSSVEGTIYSAKNEPLSGQLHVNLTMTSADGSTERFGVPTDGKGNFLFENVPAGAGTLQVYTPSNGQRSVPIRIGAGQRVRQDIEMFGGTSVRVRVSGVEGVGITAVAVRGRFEFRELSMATAQSLEGQMAGAAQINNGEGVISGLEPGTYTILAVAYDMEAAQNGGDPFATAKWGTKVIEVAAEKETEVSFSL